MERTDVELLGAWQRGEKAAGEQLFSRHFKDIRTFFRNKVSDAHAQEDLIQETFLGCVKSAGSFRGESSFRTFLFTIARRTLYDFLRARGHTVDQTTLDHSSVADLLPGPSSLLVKRRDEQLLVHALRQIPINDQTVLELYYWQELSAREVGEVMALPEGTVRSRLARAKDALARVLARRELSPAELSSRIDNIEAWLRSIREEL